MDYRITTVRASEALILLPHYIKILINMVLMRIEN